MARLKPRGLVPAVMVTTENATAGGTLSGDCLSRFSPAWGKEGEWIDSFKLAALSLAGQRHHDVDPDIGKQFADLQRQALGGSVVEGCETVETDPAGRLRIFRVRSFIPTNDHSSSTETSLTGTLLIAFSM